MPFLELEPPDWDILLGGSNEAAWLADRNRKFGLLAEFANSYLTTADRLEERGALFHCTPEVLKIVEYAADWYISLAGFSLKTLQNIKIGPREFGLKRQAKGLVESLRRGGDIPESQLAAFSEWINSEINELYPPDERKRALAVSIVFMILGGRAIGQGQNIGGDDAVVLVKSLLVGSFEKIGRSVEVQMEDGSWLEYKPEYNLPKRQRLRFGHRIMCEFISGGDRPDIIIFLDRIIIAVGEIKGRKDLSNVWESWMPGIYGHMRTWTQEHPDAARLFFGTLVNDAIIEGFSSQGTQHVGLKTLMRQGLLTAAFNVSKVADNEPAAVKNFEQFVNALDDLLSS